MAERQNPLAEDFETLPIDRLVPLYLAASYLYYIHDRSLMPDAGYDRICQRLAAEFDSVTHAHASLLDRRALEAGTAYHLRESDYPLIVSSSAWMLYDQFVDPEPAPVAAPGEEAGQLDLGF